jgi:predicted ATP-binding protein involved in virulence
VCNKIASAKAQKIQFVVSDHELLLLKTQNKKQIKWQKRAS